MTAEYNKIDYNKDDVDVMHAKLKVQHYNKINEDDTLEVQEAKLKAYQENKDKKWKAEIAFAPIEKDVKSENLVLTFYSDDLIELFDVLEFMINKKKVEERMIVDDLLLKKKEVI